MYFRSRILEINPAKEIENNYEYVIKVNKPDANTMLTNARIDDICISDIPDENGEYNCTIKFLTKNLPTIINKRKQHQEACSILEDGM